MQRKMAFVRHATRTLERAEADLKLVDEENNNAQEYLS
jgi:exonuclease VII small subunit